MLSDTTDRLVGIACWIVLAHNNRYQLKKWFLSGEEKSEEIERLEKKLEEVKKRDVAENRVFRGSRDAEERFAVNTLLCVPSLYAAIRIGASILGKEEILKSLWAKYVAKHDVSHFIRASYAFQMSIFFGIGLSVLLVDLLQMPKWLVKRKMQPDVPVDPKKLPSLFYTLMWNNCIPLNVYILKKMGLFSLLGASTEKLLAEKVSTLENTLLPKIIRISPKLPSITRAGRDTILFLMAYDIMFYYSHRLLHWKPLYKRIHKKHHEWTAPTSLAAAYAHPIEHILSNLLPALTASLIARPHVLTFNAFSAVGLLITLAEHSGYNILGDVSHYHDLHHEKFYKNYGVYPWLDRIHGTYMNPRPGLIKPRKDKPQKIEDPYENGDVEF